MYVFVLTVFLPSSLFCLQRGCLCKKGEKTQALECRPAWINSECSWIFAMWRACSMVIAFIKHVGVISKLQHCHRAVRQALYCCKSLAWLPTCLPVLQVYELQPKAKLPMPSPKISWCFCWPDGSNLRPTLSDVAVLSFFPETNKTRFRILLGLKYLSLLFTGQKRDSWSHWRKEIITGFYRSRSCATAAHSLRGRNMGPQTWNMTPSKCLRATQEKHPQRLI